MTVFLAFCFLLFPNNPMSFPNEPIYTTMRWTLWQALLSWEGGKEVTAYHFSLLLINNQRT